MTSQLEIIQEAEARGLPIPKDKKALYDEAINRGLITSPKRDRNNEPQLRQAPPKWKETARDIARPVLEGVGGLVGAVAGSGLGPPGTVAGGGIGYAIGAESADLFEELIGVRDRKPLLMELGESGKDIVVGAAYEAGGQSILPAVSPLLKGAGKKLSSAFPFTRDAVTDKAGKMLIAETTSGPLLAKNVDEARALEEAMPGLKFSRGQLTNDPNVIKFERAAARETGSVAGEQLEQAAQNSKAVKDFINKQKGAGGIGDVLDPLARQDEALEVGVETAASNLEREAATLGEGPGAIQSGETIRAAARGGKSAAKKEASKLFEDVPEFDIDARRLVDKIDELSQPLDQFEDVAENVPAFFGRAKEILQNAGGKTTPKGLQGLRREATKALRKANNISEPNETMAGRISKLIGEIDDVLKETGETTGGQARHKGQTISTGNLREELFGINKKLRDTPQYTEKTIDIDKTYDDLNNAGGIGIMRQVQEGMKSYTKRLEKSYKIEFGKDAPIKPKVERPEVRFAKKRKTEIEKILSEAEDIKTPEIEATAGKLKTAQQFYKKEVIQKYKTGSVGEILKKGHQGDKVSNANVAGKIFRPGRAGAEPAKEFMNSMGDNKQAMQAMEDYVKQDFLLSATNPVTGEITETGLKRWRFKYKTSLDELGFTKKFDSITSARKQLDSAMEMKTEFEKSLASKLLKSDVDEAIKKAFASGSKRHGVKSLLHRLKGDKKAVSGLQNSIIDHIMSVSETTARDAFDNPIVSLAGFEREFKKFKPAIEEAFRGDPLKLKALNQYRDALKTLQRGKASPLGGGSDTTENILAVIAKKMHFSKSRLLNFLKGAVKPFKDLSNDQVKAILNRAAVDPDFAYTIMGAGRGKLGVDVVERRLKGHLIAVGLRQSNREGKND